MEEDNDEEVMSGNENGIKGMNDSSHNTDDEGTVSESDNSENEDDSDKEAEYDEAEDGESGGEEEDSRENGENLKFPETTIRKIDRKKALVFIKKENNKDLADIQICQEVINKYNQKEDCKYEKVENMTNPDPDPYPKSLVVAFTETKETNSSLDAIFRHYAIETRKNVQRSLIVFIMPEKINERSIYCITYGNSHWVVHDLEDAEFSNRMAQYATTKELKRMDIRHLTGTDYALHNFYRYPTIPDMLQAFGVVTNIHSRIGGTILETEQYLKIKLQRTDKDATNQKRGARVQVSTSGVRICKEMRFGNIIDLIENIDENAEKGGDGSELFEYITKVEDDELVQTLNDKMMTKIFSDMKKDVNANDAPQFDVAYKDYEKHHDGTNFSFGVKDKDKWGELLSYRDAIDKLKSYLPNYLKSLVLYFEKDKKKLGTRKFLLCFEGEQEHENKKYEKKDGKWFLKEENQGTKKRVTDGIEEALDVLLVEKIKNDVNAGVPGETSQFQFIPPEGHSHFSFGKGKKNKMIQVSSYNDVIRELISHFNNTNSSDGDAMNLSNMVLSFEKNENELGKKKFLLYFEGKQAYKGKNYEKKNGKWHLKEENQGTKKRVTNSGIKKALDNLLVMKIIKDLAVNPGTSSKFEFKLPMGHSHALFGKEKNEKTQLTRASSYKDAILKLKSHIMNVKLSFTCDGKPYNSPFLDYFHGEIVHKKNIYHKVDEKWLRFEQSFNEAIEHSFQKFIDRKFHDDGDEMIHLTEIWPGDISEGEYNELYSQIKDFYVGDRIEPFNVELFDIMKVTDHKIFLYHVKKDFGVITRVACSQIRTSAICISRSRQNPSSKENILKKFYNVVVDYGGKDEYRLAEKEKLEAVGEKFLEWFQTKHIVFVYAFTSETLKERKLKDFKTNAGKFSKSLIAKYELQSTNLFLEELGFEFAICQIYRTEE